MTKKPTLSRPAASAIAAFLALSTPAALAQTAPVAEPAPPTVMAPPVAPTVPTTTSPVAAPAPAPAPVIRVPLDLPAAPVAQSEPRPAAKAAARPAPKAAPRVAAAERTAPAAPAPVEAAPVAATAAAASALPAAEVAPVAPVVDPAPTAVTTEAAAPSDGFPWEIVGGAAALLLAGGVGLTFARRRRHAVAADAWEFRKTAAETEWVPTAPAAAPVVAREAEPMVNPEPIPAPAPVEEPVRRTTPSFAAAPSGSMGRHEAMALVGPTADNPFATLSKRLKRARFLDRKERVAYEATLAGEQPVASEPARQPVSAWEIAQRPAPAVPAQQDVRRPEPVQRGLSHGFRRPDFARK
ncbi:hypothetical protein BWQ93_00760 [Sphingopyxis sp. QXT-31]|uniref:hypothetical protein n=1 Tax=Sphingopyxis sp. QXT-31 TaxID=1357916 RepID=UPI00097984CB|nr:hypothetical protein [Sphingopyxis sp. QXT-31]APZ97184.1 hypothetical protein BWQ93_00760 [Sphingopyxis sp. QXT-31]